MVWKNFFGKTDKKGGYYDPLKDLTLSNMQKGYLVEYDLKTWEVEACNHYDWGDGDITLEWRLKSHDDIICLEKESDDGDEWSISRPIPFGRIGSKIRNHILKHGDPPDQIVFEGDTYYLESFGGGHFFKDRTGMGAEFLSWDYEDDSGRKYLSIEQWGEEEFEASVGEPVEEYQFTNILPREMGEA